MRVYKEADLQGTGIINFTSSKHLAWHFIGTNYITIGCRDIDINISLDEAEELGKLEKYNHKEIKLYINFVKLIKSLYKEEK